MASVGLRALLKRPGPYYRLFLDPAVKGISTRIFLPSGCVRFASGSAVKSEELKQKQVSWVQWLFGNNDKPETTVQSVDEQQERMKLLAKVKACYYAKPPTEPGKELFIEAFNLLIKYDDLKGVENLWGLLKESGHELDDDLIDKIEDFIIQGRDKLWHKD